MLGVDRVSDGAGVHDIASTQNNITKTYFMIFSFMEVKVKDHVTKNAYDYLKKSKTKLK